jgi:hypothetical protein
MDMATTTHHEELAMNFTDEQIQTIAKITAELGRCWDHYKAAGLSTEDAKARLEADFDNWTKGGKS